MMLILSALTFVGALKTVFYIFIAILALMFMIVVHEFGHYIAGIKLGFKVNEFAIGFGKPIFQRVWKNGVKFSIRPVPLGGFCAFEGEDEERGEEVEGAFNNQAPWKRLIVLFSGAFFNFVSAVIILTIFFSIWGQPLTTVVGVFDDSTSRSNSWFQEGDAVLTVNGKLANVLTADDSAFNNLGDSATFRVLREGKVVEFTAEKGDYTVYSYRLTDGLSSGGQALIGSGAVYLHSITDDKGGEQFDYILPQYYSSSALAEKISGMQNPEQMIFIRYTDGEGNNVSQSQYRALSADGGKVSREIYYINFEDEVKDAVVSEENELGESVTTITLLKGAVLSVGGVETNLTSLADRLTGDNSSSYGFGVSSGVYINRLGFFRALVRALPYTFYVVFKIFASLGQLITGKLALSSAGGAITVITTISKATQQGFYNLFWVICILSANLAVMNLLPIPALDGSKMVFTAIEWIRKKPINRKVEAVIHTVGLIALFSLTVFLDIFHLVS